ncbi:hypothetical protein [Vreelandella nigrificans]|nr:hypothetical protein [Halomonas nigrificans]
MCPTLGQELTLPGVAQSVVLTRTPVGASMNIDVIDIGLREVKA